MCTVHLRNDLLLWISTMYHNSHNFLDFPVVQIKLTLISVFTVNLRNITLRILRVYNTLNFACWSTLLQTTVFHSFVIIYWRMVITNTSFCYCKCMQFLCNIAVLLLSLDKLRVFSYTKDMKLFGKITLKFF